MRIVRLPGIHHDANAVLLMGSKQAILIDSGTAWYQLLQQERIVGQLGEDVTLREIILTSRRYPFSGGCAFLSEQFDHVPIMAHASAIPSLSTGDFFTTWANRYDSDMPNVQAVELDGEQRLFLDDEVIEIIEAPGPSSCNLMVHIPSAKTVVVGALVPRADRPFRWDVPTGNLILGKESLEKLLKIEVDKLIPMQGPSIRGSNHIRETINRHLSTLQKIIEEQGALPRSWPKPAHTSLWHEPVPSWPRKEQEKNQADGKSRN
ncbi:MAG: MBL fold metallo-hydrolase [Candidatus Thermoplasmatota archaeon]|nr:MBL fold metallo-hydrolase [Candidatus Thermoplasmatota archaeon]MEC7254193.1 MBL fold metallo-hydrolase [Candidatus Thermoplasmatota archaeon]MEC8609682.1 MBL fold metallo-hydrolase [Candidatus Thermoplasmatota archaeon]